MDLHIVYTVYSTLFLTFQGFSASKTQVAEQRAMLQVARLLGRLQVANYDERPFITFHGFQNSDVCLSFRYFMAFYTFKTLDPLQMFCFQVHWTTSQASTERVASFLEQVQLSGGFVAIAIMGYTPFPWGKVVLSPKLWVAHGSPIFYPFLIGVCFTIHLGDHLC